LGLLCCCAVEALVLPLLLCPSIAAIDVTAAPRIHFSYKAMPRHRCNCSSSCRMLWKTH